MPSTCVIYNPASGRGKAEKLLEEIQATLGAGVELRPTARPGHAVDLAREAALQGFEKVVAAGGDGTVHEVANGLIQSDRRDVIFSTWPIGSANDYAYTLGMLEFWRRRTERLPTEVLVIDVGRLIGGGRERFFVDAAGVGFNGMVTLESRKIRWLRGLPLYAIAFLIAMMKHFATPRMATRSTILSGKCPRLQCPFFWGNVRAGSHSGRVQASPMASSTTCTPHGSVAGT